MRTETRANLIFLAILLALMLPGGLVLFRQKLQPGARPIGAPDPVRRTTPYMDPTPVAGPVTRIIPPQTARWVASLSHRYAPDSAPHPEPVMSDRRSFEVIGDFGSPGERTITLLCWDQALCAEPSQLSFALPGSAPLQTLHSESLGLPPQVRKELQEAGWPRPPHEIVVIRLGLSPSLSSHPIRLSISRGPARRDPVDFVTLFTNPAPAGK